MEGNEVALSRKPRAERTGSNPTEVEISALIEKGGSVPGEAGKGEEGSRSFLVRIDHSLFESVNQAVQRNPVIKSRNTWVVNAIYEQLKRDGMV